MKGTESETIYQITWDDLHAAAVLMCSYKHRGEPGCEICDTIMDVIPQDNVKKYISSQKFRDGDLPVETVMCDNLKGWGSFSNSALGIHSNVCFSHGRGMMPYF